jgi:hypothetical protein
VQIEQVFDSRKRLVTERGSLRPLAETKLELRDQPGDGQREPDGGSNMEQEMQRKLGKIVQWRKRTLSNWEGAPMSEGAIVGLTNQSSEALLESEGRLEEGHAEPIKSKEIVRKRKRKPEKVLRLRKRTLPDPEGFQEVLGFEPYEVRSESKDELGKEWSKLVKSNSTCENGGGSQRKWSGSEGVLCRIGKGKARWLAWSWFVRQEVTSWPWNPQAGCGTRKRGTECKHPVSFGKRTEDRIKEGLLAASRTEISPKAMISHEKESPGFLGSPNALLKGLQSRFS